MRIVNNEDAATFVSNQPTPKEVGGLTVPELRLIATHLGATDYHQLLKTDLVSLVLQQISLVGDESESLHSETEGDRMDEGLREPQADPEIRRLEVQLPGLPKLRCA